MVALGPVKPWASRPKATQARTLVVRAWGLSNKAGVECTKPKLSGERHWRKAAATQGGFNGNAQHQLTPRRERPSWVAVQLGSGRQSGSVGRADVHCKGNARFESVLAAGQHCSAHSRWASLPRTPTPPARPAPQRQHSLYWYMKGVGTQRLKYSGGGASTT